MKTSNQSRVSFRHRLRLIGLTFCALLVCMLVPSLVLAQGVPLPAPQALTPAFIIATLLPLTLGALNALQQTGKLFNLVSIPTKVLPWLATLGSFLTGVSAYVASQSPFVVTGAAVFMMLVAGAYSLFIGTLPGQVSHHFGGQVNAKRPASDPVPTDESVAQAKIDANAKTDPPKAA